MDDNDGVVTTTKTKTGGNPGKFYSILGRQPPRTLSKFTNSILSQIGRRPAPPVPNSGPAPSPPPSEDDETTTDHPSSATTAASDDTTTTSDFSPPSVVPLRKHRASRPEMPEDALSDVTISSDNTAEKNGSYRRGSLRNHSATVMQAALNSARAKASVQRIVNDSKFYPSFLAFCSKEWCGENPRFLKAVGEYKAVISAEEKNGVAIKIFADFFDEKTAQHPVSLPAAKLHRLIGLYEQKSVRASGALYDEAFSTIERELSLDVFPRYLNSEGYESIFLKPKDRTTSSSTNRRGGKKKPVCEPISACTSFDSSSMVKRVIQDRLSPSKCNAAMKGWLEKRGGRYSFSGWKRRWCVLRQGFLFYFTPHQSMTDEAVKPQGQIALREVTKILKTRLSDGTPCFALVTAPRRYDFKACSLCDRDGWVKALKKMMTARA